VFCETNPIPGFSLSREIVAEDYTFLKRYYGSISPGYSHADGSMKSTGFGLNG
jgi:hypothetical protein